MKSRDVSRMFRCRARRTGAGIASHPFVIEFWYNRDDRLHVRWLYERATEDDVWSITQLYP